MATESGRSPSGSGSRASHGADKSSPPKASIPNAAVLVCASCGATVAQFANAMCCHCATMHWNRVRHWGDGTTPCHVEINHPDEFNISKNAGYPQNGGDE